MKKLKIKRKPREERPEGETPKKCVQRAGDAISL